ncbi:GNAT family N-acetyltransferase [Allobranchiibius sp. CTAmp26]|uniref:GNAT family N-acetyltransferase n=1 Tax=Allobranchiibius sp. CTAmp26 TaxID=2815214 RepID=UPI001AA14446|nr:GNAT family N-acetyltransferase [Allobranchiibius sp. CTAmp26]MBO1754370.1 GNAT family N-acetyltransferase [Allobranchiibius sp. CTAmp26]
MPRPDTTLSVHSLSDGELDETLIDQTTELLGELIAGGAALGWLSPPPRAEIAAVLSRIATAPDGSATLLVARHEGRLAGFGFWERYARPTFARHADLVLLAVGDSWQGAGVGRRLCGELVASARRAGVEKLTVDFRDDNVRAQALYESLGFRRYGVLGDFVVAGGQRFDRMMYVLDLR